MDSPTFGQLTQSNLFYPDQEGWRNRPQPRPFPQGRYYSTMANYKTNYKLNHHQPLNIRPRPQSPIERIDTFQRVTRQHRNFQQQQHQNFSRNLQSNREIGLQSLQQIARMQMQMLQLQRERQALRQREREQVVIQGDRERQLQQRLRQRRQQIDQVRSRLNFQYPRRKDDCLAEGSLSEKTLFRQFRRRDGPPNVFLLEESIRQKLRKCEECSTNIQVKQLDCICLEKSCSSRFGLVCDSCAKNPHDDHHNHKIYPILAYLYNYQNKQANSGLKEQKKLVNQSLESVIILQSEIQVIRSELQKISKNLKAHSHLIERQESHLRHSEQQVQRLLQNVQSIQTDSLQSLIKSTAFSFQESIGQQESEIPSLDHKQLQQAVLRTKQIVQNLPKFKQRGPEVNLQYPSLISQQNIVPYLTLFNNFQSHQITLSNTWSCQIPELGDVVLLCEGQNKIRLSKVSRFKFLFIGKRNQKEVKSVLEMAQLCSRKKKFKGFSLTLDYKSNFHAGLQPTDLLNLISKISGKQVKLHIQNMTFSQTTPQIIQKYLKAISRQMVSIQVSISFNPLYFHADCLPLLRDSQASLFKHLLQRLGDYLIKFSFQVKLGLQQSTLALILNQLSSKPFLMQFDMLEGNSRQIQLRKTELKQRCRRRRVALMYLQQLKSLGIMSMLGKSECIRLIALNI